MKDCPFCGNQPDTELIMVVDGDARVAICQTPGCPMYKRVVPVKMWNQRGGKEGGIGQRSNGGMK